MQPDFRECEKYTSQKTNKKTRARVRILLENMPGSLKRDIEMQLAMSRDPETNFWESSENEYAMLEMHLMKK